MRPRSPTSATTWSTCRVLRAAGLSAAPADAVQEVRDNVDLVLDARGGRGAARELVDRIIDALGPVS